MSERSPIFNTPSEALAHYAECALATAEGLDLVKSSSASTRRRAWSIANGMVAECIRHKVPLPEPFSGRGLPRLQKRMEASDVQ